MGKKVLLGTTNPSKIKRFQDLLSDYAVEFYMLRDLHIVDEPEETGKTPEENAVLKAKFYGKYFDRVVCNDSGLYFDELPLENPRQPGLHIRTPQGTRLDDEQMISYYASLVHELGGKVLAYYLDGIAVYCCGKISSMMETSDATKLSAFYLVDHPSPKRHPGWPLDSLSLNRKRMALFVAQEKHREDTIEEQIILGEYRKRLIAFLVEALALEKHR